jgi:superfamily II DNA helicase RecQ
MRKTNFFQQAPAQDTYQKRFLEAVLGKRHIIATFPVGYPTVSLYALAALVSEGLAVIVCHNGSKIRRNLDYFYNAGLRFPDVAFLDGTQMPHEERQIHQEINRNRVRVLYITPERFISLTFLEVLVHQHVTFLAIEEAERLLSDMPGHAPYRKLYEHGLQQLAQLPSLMLMLPMMTPGRVETLARQLRLGEFQSLHCPPAVDTVELRVRRLFSEHQKFQDLIGFLSDGPGDGSLGRLDAPGSVLIQAAFPAQAEKLGASLIDYGFESVYVTHYKKTFRDQLKALETASVQPNSILVTAGADVRGWMPSSSAVTKLVYWTPPTSLDELFMQVFRQPAEKRLLETQPVKARVYHTKEDFTAAIRPYTPEQSGETREASEKLKALNLYRQWVLDDACRLKSAAAYLQESSLLAMPPCGQCDRCTETRNFRWKLDHAFRKWLY